MNIIFLSLSDLMEQLQSTQVAYNAEWALAKFFSALREDGISERFLLKSVCGLEKDYREAIKSLEIGIRMREELLEQEGWRTRQRNEEIKSANELIRRLNNSDIEYIRVNEDNGLPVRVYNSSDAVVIHSSNVFHLPYIIDAINNGVNVICEKPLIPVIDENGKPNRDSLNSLEDIVANADPSLVLMDAEHYSYKIASLIFYENLERILNGKKIREINGEIKEIDNPFFWRTQEILSCKNQTGLLGDTMCHLLAFISNLGGEARPLKREYAQYKNNGTKYNIDTYDHVEYYIEEDRYFAGGATADFTVTKFVDRKRTPENQESKYIKLILDDGSEVVVDFRKGTVKKDDQRVAYRYPLSKNEYVNSLGHFYEAVRNRNSPLTDFRNSIKTLNSIYDSYNLPSDRNRQVEVYQDVN